MNGVFVPGVPLAVDPRALRRPGRALGRSGKWPPTHPAGHAPRSAGSRRRSAKLIVYRTGLIRDVKGTNQLAYEVVVTNGSSVRDAVFVDANTGKVINRYTLVDNALSSRAVRAEHEQPGLGGRRPVPGALNEDQQNIVNFSGHSYYHFFNAFGRDSYDGAGATMRSVNNDPTIACPNANWNGATTNYCNGVTSDDVVAHEWGHAYTEYTHNLIYQWQPGALNESYSDIWGETVDMINGARHRLTGPVRTVGSCSAFSGARVVVINSPASIAQTCPAATAAFGPPVMGTGVTGNVVLADDGVGPTRTLAQPLANAGAVAGNIAFVDRGTCTFKTKTKNAQNAGATGRRRRDNSRGARRSTWATTR